MSCAKLAFFISYFKSVTLDIILEFITKSDKIFLCLLEMFFTITFLNLQYKTRSKVIPTHSTHQFPSLHPLKTSENLWFSVVFRVYEMGTLVNHGTYTQIIAARLSISFVANLQLYKFVYYLQTSSISLALLKNYWVSLRQKCPNMELFLVRIFLYSVRMQENTDRK